METGIAFFLIDLHVLDRNELTNVFWIVLCIAKLCISYEPYKIMSPYNHKHLCILVGFYVIDTKKEMSVYKVFTFF